MPIRVMTIAGAAALAAAPAFAASGTQPTMPSQKSSQAGSQMKTAASMSGKAGGMGTNAPDAMMHFKAIADANPTAIMKTYGPRPVVEWVGGKLNGTYVGQDAITDMWRDFAKGVGRTTLKVSDIRVNTAPKDGMTVTADVVFKGKATIPVRYVLVYRNRKIVDEVWQVAPDLMSHA